MQFSASNVFRRSGLWAAFAVILLIVGTSACSKDTLEEGLSGPVPTDSVELMTELQDQRDKIDQANSKMFERIEQFNAARAPGERKIQFSEVFYADLDPEQRDLLDQLLAEEKNPSYKNLLTRIIDDRNRIQQMQEDIVRLEQRLADDFVIVQKGNTHLELARNFLLEKGVAEQEADRLLKQIDLSEDLLPGFHIWYNYDEETGKFRTYVTQGEAGQTPLAVKRAVKTNLINERDAALAKATALEETKVQLEGDIVLLEKDIIKLEDRRRDLEVSVADLEARNDELIVRSDALETDLSLTQNSLYYYADSAKTLSDQGILTRFLKNLKDVKGISYDETLDLRQAKTISFSPETYGLKSIQKIEVLPEIFQEGRDYTIQVSAEGGPATFVITDPNVFRQKRIIFALRGDT